MTDRPLMAAWDVDRCPQHHCRIVRGQCPTCRDEAYRATQRIRARSQPRDEHGNFIRGIHDRPVGTVDEPAGDEAA